MKNATSRHATVRRALDPVRDTDIAVLECPDSRDPLV
jgi:hypothetical protein